MFSNRVQECVAATLDELSQQERTAFVLRHFEGQSIDEISAALGLSNNAAKHSIFRAVQKLRRALEPRYPALHGVHLTDYKVRILAPEDATRAVTRVLIESRDADDREWCTVGLGANVIDASYRALEDSLKYRLLLM